MSEVLERIETKEPEYSLQLLRNVDLYEDIQGMTDFLVDIFDYNEDQAEQLIILSTLKGKVELFKSDDLDQLLRCKRILGQLGLKSSTQKINNVR